MRELNRLPSPPCAIGTNLTLAATAAADPPLDPPEERVISQGFVVGPKCRGSVVGLKPNSGVFVFPTITRPACLNRLTSSLSCVET